jgi:hypothetical protein
MAWSARHAHCEVARRILQRAEADLTGRARNSKVARSAGNEPLPNTRAASSGTAARPVKSPFSTRCERIVMAIDPGTRSANPTMDAKSLYREEIYTDRAVGTLRVLIPVTADGAPDPSRRNVYTGEAQLMTSVGPLPISFEIPGAALAEVVANYAEAAKEGVAHAMRELAEMRRQASSSIVIPQGGALPPGGPLGGGKIQLP